MLTANRDLMARARESLKNRWGILVGITALYLIISAIAGRPKFPTGWIINLIIGGPLAVGYYTVCLSLIRGQEVKINLFFKGFDCFFNALKTYLFMLVFIILWALLLIVPGIMAACSYALAFFLIADNPSMGALEALKKSRQLMYGKRWKLCCFGFRFIGWGLLGCITLGIGFLWVIPYMITSFAHFYQDVLENVQQGTDGTTVQESVFTPGVQ